MMAKCQLRARNGVGEISFRGFCAHYKAVIVGGIERIYFNNFYK